MTGPAADGSSRRRVQPPTVETERERQRERTPRTATLRLWSRRRQQPPPAASTRTTQTPPANHQNCLHKQTNHQPPKLRPQNLLRHQGRPPRSARVHATSSTHTPSLSLSPSLSLCLSPSLSLSAFLSFVHHKCVLSIDGPLCLPGVRRTQVLERGMQRRNANGRMDVHLRGEDGKILRKQSGLHSQGRVGWCL